MKFFMRWVIRQTGDGIDPRVSLSLEANGALDRLEKQAALEETEDGELSFDGKGASKVFISAFLGVGIKRWDKIRDELKAAKLLGLSKKGNPILPMWPTDQSSYFDERAYQKEYKRKQRKGKRQGGQGD